MGSAVSYQPESFKNIKEKYEELKIKQIENKMSDEELYNEITAYINAINKLSHAAATSHHNKNIAFVFIKPHANNSITKELVSSTLLKKGLIISKEGIYI